MNRTVPGWIEDGLEKVDNTLANLSTLLTEVLQSGQSEHAGLKQIERLLARDAPLCTRVLRAANSPIYGHGSVSRPNNAIARLGVRNVRAIILAEVIQSLSRDVSAPHNLLYPRSIWKHSTAVMCAARQLINLGVAPCVSEEEAAAAALLHDLGRLILLSLAPKECALLGRALGEFPNIPLIEMERAVFRCTHEQVGALLAQRWRLPAALVAAIGGHGGQNFMQVEGVDLTVPPHAALIHVANCLAHQAGLGHQRGFYDSIAPSALACLNLAPQTPLTLKDTGAENTGAENTGAEDTSAASNEAAVAEHPILTQVRATLPQEVMNTSRWLGG